MNRYHCMHRLSLREETPNADIKSRKNHRGAIISSKERIPSMKWRYKLQLKTRRQHFLQHELKDSTTNDDYIQLEIIAWYIQMTESLKMKMKWIRVAKANDEREASCGYHRHQSEWRRELDDPQTVDLRVWIEHSMTILLINERKKDINVTEQEMSWYEACYNCHD